MLKSKKLCLHHLDIPLVIPKSPKTKCFHKKCGFAAKYTLRDFSIISPFRKNFSKPPAQNLDFFYRPPAVYWRGYGSIYLYFYLLKMSKLCGTMK